MYIWADGIHFNVRLEEGRQCILVVMGTTEDGKKELLAVEDGVPESTQSWKEILIGLKSRGLEQGPNLAVGDGALTYRSEVGLMRVITGCKSAQGGGGSPDSVLLPSRPC